MTRSNNSSLFIVLLIIFTFPVWIGIAGGLFGLAAGVFGACIGIIAGIFGAIGSVFGVFDWSVFPHIHIGGFRFFLVVAIIFAIVMMSRSKKSSRH